MTAKEVREFLKDIPDDYCVTSFSKQENIFREIVAIKKDAARTVTEMVSRVDWSVSTDCRTPYCEVVTKAKPSVILEVG